MSMLAIEPQIQASQICDSIKIDKGAASRALARLEDMGLLSQERQPNDPRKRIWWLNASGQEMHDKILEIALERERRLIEGVSPEDLEAFLRAIRKMFSNVDAIR